MRVRPSPLRRDVVVVVVVVDVGVDVVVVLDIVGDAAPTGFDSSS